MKFSIITVSFNAAATIRDALTSVVSQQGVEVESIVIDGGSTDDTPAIVSAFGKQIAHYTSEPDRGIYDAMNKGLAKASGDVIAFLNADDYYAESSTLSKVARLFSAEVTAVAGAVRQLDAAGSVVRLIRASGYQPGKMHWGMVPPHPGLFVKARVVRDAGGFDQSFRISGDFDLFVRMSRHPKFVLATTDEVLVSMRTGGVSTSGVDAYLRSTSELKHALRKNGFGGSHWRVDLRALRKVPELIGYAK